MLISEKHCTEGNMWCKACTEVFVCSWTRGTWFQASIKLLYPFFSLPTPGSSSRGNNERANGVSNRFPNYLEQSKAHKLLLLGHEGSGRSTIFKQVSKQTLLFYCNSAHWLPCSFLQSRGVHGDDFKAVGCNHTNIHNVDVLDGYLLGRPKFCTMMGLQRKRRPTSSLSYKQIYTSTWASYWKAVSALRRRRMTWQRFEHCHSWVHLHLLVQLITQICLPSQQVRTFFTLNVL